METIEEGPSATMFKHEPLPDSNTYIRLLEIQSIESGDQLICNLTAWPIKDAPDYIALSYVLRKQIEVVIHTDRSLYQIYLGLTISKSSDLH